MRMFVAGATGVIGIRLVPLLVEAGHTVAGMTRSPAKAAELEAPGAEAVVCDVYDLEALRTAVARFEPDPPRIHVDEAARRTMPILEAPPRIVEVVE
jgi:nucleoside-diphosphate-sugar epimerase